MLSEVDAVPPVKRQRCTPEHYLSRWLLTAAMPASVPRQLLQAVLRRAARACGRSCLRKALPARWQRREYGLPVRIVHRDERTKQPAGESQGASRPACPVTCVSRGPAPRRRLRHPWRGRVSRAERFQAAWRSTNVPPVRQCPAEGSRFDCNWLNGH